MSYKITDLTPKAAPLGATDLLETSVDMGGSHVSKSVTGKNIKDYIGLGGENYIFVDSKGTPNENGDNLSNTYASLSGVTPHGEPLGPQNTMTILLAPGIYRLPNVLVLDNEYIHISSLTTQPDAIISLAGGSPSDIVIGVASENVNLTGIDTANYGFAIDSFFGLYTNVYTNCKTSSNSFGSLLDSYATYINCTAGNNSFGDVNNNISASGTYINCTAGNNSFGYNANGYFEDCTAGNNSFGSNTFDGFAIRCKAANNSFGADRVRRDGKLMYCSGGRFSFGYIGGLFDGQAVSCVASETAFGVRDGSLLYCSYEQGFTFSNFLAPSGSGKIILCIDSSGNIVNL